MTTFSHEQLRDIVTDNIVDVIDLVTMLEITIEDIMDAFPERLYIYQDVLVPNLTPFGEEDELLETDEEANEEDSTAQRVG